MIVPPFTGKDNTDFLTNTKPYFDDHLVRKEHTLQLRLKQLAPALLEGGRAFLWYCYLCQKPWYHMGRIASHMRLSSSQLAEIRQQLGVKVCTPSLLPRSMCPLCATLHPGGMPTIEEYLDDQGYRFSWQARTLLHTRLFCHIYRWNKGSISEMVQKADSAPCDVLTAHQEQVQSIVVLLKTLAEPGKEQTVLLIQNDMKSMNRLHPAAPGFAWCGYGWKSSCPLLGQVLVTLGMTFPDSSICSAGLLVACRRQIAYAVERVMVYVND